MKLTTILVITALTLTAIPAHAATIYDKGRMSVEGTKKLAKGSITVTKTEIRFQGNNQGPDVVIPFEEILTMSTSQRKKKYGGATAAAVILTGGVGFAMLAANKKFTMVTIETGESLFTLGVRKRQGAEFLRRLEKASGMEVEE